MTPFANATTPVRAAQGTALALGAGALFLLVASNVLLLGLRLHDGGLHWSEIATGWPRYGADPRFDRWLTLSTLTGVVVVFGLLGAIFRHRPLPLHGSARFASEREIKAAGLRSKEGVLLGRKDGAHALLRRIGTCPGLRPNPRREGRRLCHSEPAQLAGFRCRAGREEGELGSLGGISRSPWAGGPSVRSA